ncbi:MAG: C4-dicarboxylate transporter DcuC [Campylobacteraceae bacterium]
MSGNLGLIVGVIILLVTIYMLIKQYETRMVLLASGFIMAILALKPLDAFTGFSSGMTQAGLIQNICATLGFAAVLKITKCDLHLVNFMSGGLKYLKPALIPAIAIITYCINIALPSAGGCAAAVGVIMIPLAISQGVHPATAASAVMLGTFGSVLSPGNTHNNYVADLVKKTYTESSITVMDIISNHFFAAIVAILIGATSLLIVSIIRKENKGYDSTVWFSSGAAAAAGGSAPKQEEFKVNVFYALIPLLPIIALVAFSFGSVQEVLPWAKKFGVPHAMLTGAFLCLAATRTNPQTATKEFFSGMGKGYADIIGIIICATVFIAGLKALGVIDYCIELLKHSEGNAAGIASIYGPFLLGIVSGSGDAATLAFNGAVTPHAELFGLTIEGMGSAANVGGALGRTMSPIAGAAIICAGLARVNPMELTKRNAIGMIIASISLVFTLL